MKNVIKNEKAHGLMKAGLALLLSGSVACGEAPTSYSEYVEDGPNVWAFEAERQFEEVPQLGVDTINGDEMHFASEVAGDHLGRHVRAALAARIAIARGGVI